MPPWPPRSLTVRTGRTQSRDKTGTAPPKGVPSVKVTESNGDTRHERPFPQGLKEAPERWPTPRDAELGHPRLEGVRGRLGLEPVQSGPAR